MNAASRPARPRRIFYSVAAQWDNLGDIEIRDTLLSWLRDLRVPVHAYVGSMPSEYLEAFDSTGVTWEADAGRYVRALWWAILRRRAHIVFAPGPQMLVGGVRPFFKSFVNLFNVAAVRASGGAALAVGRSFRGTHPAARGLERVVVQAFTLFTVRDDRSAEVLGLPVRLAPDLAFAHGIGETGDPVSRTRVAISMRGDRPLEADAIAQLVRRLQELGAEPVLVTQVKRDDAPHERLARELGVIAVLWGDRDHRTQRDRVRAVYRESSAVVSNRLHALLMGLREGAVPIAISEPAIDKLASTMRPWVPYLSTPPDLRELDGEAWDLDRIRESASAVRKGAGEAAAVAARLRQEVLVHLRT